MSQSPSVRQLLDFIAQETPQKPRKTKPKSETADKLTRHIISHIRANGGFATRLKTTGTYKASLKKYVPSQQVAGLPDVFAVVEGRAVFVKIKVGTNRVSDEQKQTISDLIASGASVITARDFSGFLKWFTSILLTITEADELSGPNLSRS